MLSRERQALRAARRIYRSGARKPEDVLRVAVVELLGMGGLYVKFAQLLLLNQVFTKAVPAEIRRQIFDRVKVDEHAGLNYYLPQSEMAALSQQLTLTSPRPLFAGSFAAVFEARLHTGEEVIVKVLRPELRKTLKQDLRLLTVIMRPLKVVGPEIRIAIESIMSNFRQAVLQETNYRLELRNAQALERVFRNDPTIYIPRTYESLCTSLRIVQEKVSGLWLSEVLARVKEGQSAADFVRERLGTDLEQQLYSLGFYSLVHCLEGEIIHGDPHPGNVVLMPDNRVGLIDFGLIAPPIKNRVALMEYLKVQVGIHHDMLDVPALMLAALRFHTNYLYRALVSLSALLKRPLLDDLYQVLQGEMDNASLNIDLGRFRAGDYSNALNDTINKGNRFGLMPQWDQPLTQKALIALWRTNEELGYKALNPTIFQRVVENIEARFDTASWQEEAMAPDRAMEVVGEWLMGIAEKDPDLFQRIRGLFNGVDKPAVI